MLSSLLYNIKRISVELTLLLIIGALLFVFDFRDNQLFGRSLFMYKVLLFSASQIHAHATRKLLFPYIDFSSETSMGRAMVIAIHIAAAYVYAEGG